MSSCLGFWGLGTAICANDWWECCTVYSDKKKGEKNECGLHFEHEDGNEMFLKEFSKTDVRIDAEMTC